MVTGRRAWLDLMPGPTRAAVRRLASTAGALTVAGIAALASYTHMRDVALRYGQSDLIAALLPISVDGLMVVATVALADGRRYRWSAWLTFWIGVAASVTANVLAAEPSLIARCISAWPAVAFLLVIEVLTRGGRARPPATPARVVYSGDQPVPWRFSPDEQNETAVPAGPAVNPSTPSLPTQRADGLRQRSRGRFLWPRLVRPALAGGTRDPPRTSRRTSGLRPDVE